MATLTICYRHQATGLSALEPSQIRVAHGPMTKGTNMRLTKGSQTLQTISRVKMDLSWVQNLQCQGERKINNKLKKFLYCTILSFNSESKNLGEERLKLKSIGRNMDHLDWLQLSRKLMRNITMELNIGIILLMMKILDLSFLVWSKKISMVEINLGKLYLTHK